MHALKGLFLKEKPPCTSFNGSACISKMRRSSQQPLATSSSEVPMKSYTCLLKMARTSTFAILALFCAAMLLAGCNGFIIPPLAGSAAALGQYHAYGDSITFGYSLNIPTTQSYPALVAQVEQVDLSNYAIPGAEACDIPTTEIFPSRDSPTLAAHPTYTILIGTNDSGIGGVGPYEAVFILCHEASISWLAIPAEYKVLATGSGVTTSGPGAIDTTNNWNSWTTEGMGSSVSFTITTSKPGAIYAWPRINDDNPSTYTYSLDGVVIGTGNVQTTPLIATGNGTSNSLSFIRLPPVPAGKHVVTFMQTSAGATGVSVVGIATPAAATGDTFPTVLAGIIPFELQGASASCDSTDGDCAAYNLDIEADVNLFVADGLNVRIFNTRNYMFGTAAEMNDTWHPNAFGQLELSHSVEAIW
jgi:hypothetical protein